MTHPNSPPPHSTSSDGALGKGLTQTRRLRAKGTDRIVPGDGLFWSPLTAGPYLVPVTRWNE
jgi:hypothetical protein